MLAMPSSGGHGAAISVAEHFLGNLPGVRSRSLALAFDQVAFSAKRQASKYSGMR